MTDRSPEWTAAYREADALFARMRAAERRSRREDVREAYRRAGDDANARARRVCVPVRRR